MASTAMSIANDEGTISTLGSTSKTGSGAGSSRRSKRSNTSSRATEEEIAATRHLRLMVEATLTGNAQHFKDGAVIDAASLTKNKPLANFESLLENAEKKLHYNNNKLGGGAVDEAGLLVDTTTGKNAAVYGGKSNNVGKKKKRQSLIGQFLNKKKNTSNKSKSSTGALEALEEEPVSFDDQTHTADSIIDVRQANSEDYTASICSIRSLGTFEKDFVTNIIAENEAVQYEEISVCTFEEDFKARQGGGGAVLVGGVAAAGRGVGLPMEVGGMTTTQPGDDDDLTLEPILSETTFEKDARKAAMNDGVMPPTQVSFGANGGGENNYDDDDDGLTVEEALSETTFEQDAARNNAAQANGNAPTTLGTMTDMWGVVKTALSTDSARSVSTFEKDNAARKALAIKIGRKPSTNSLSGGGAGSAGVQYNGSDRSECTFEIDYNMRRDRSQRSQKTKASVRSGASSGAKTNTAIPIMDLNLVPSETSHGFERDANKQFKNTSTNKNGDMVGFEKDVSRNMEVLPAARTRSGATHLVKKEAAHMPKIDELVVELSPDAIDRGIKKQQQQDGGIWSRFLCYCTG
eukprot:g11335.t1 g11335   contig5:623245-625075(-)